LFYGWWDWRFLWLIIFSGLIDYGAGLAMERAPDRKKTWLIASLLGNLGGLAVFKYSVFFAESLDALAAYLGYETMLVESLPEFALITPVGISFYTFQSMSYTIDIYRGKLKPTRHILHFFAYLSMFPQLVAGPIVRAKDLLYQLEQNTTISAMRIWFGLRLMVYGFFQKMVIADNLGVLVNRTFWNVDKEPTCIFWWMVMAAFSFQIYFDFAGYTSIARGLAKLMGYRFRINFNHPYQALSLREFWTRWHISLSTWFRDYVYIPLGGNRGAKWKGYANMWVTMLLSGLWHGAALNFILWGAVHAFCLSVERLTQWPQMLHKFILGRFIAWWIVWVQVLVAWVFFRASTTDQALTIIGNLFTWNFEGTTILVDKYFNTVVFLSIAVGVELWYAIKRRHYTKINPYTRTVAYDVMTMALLIGACVYFRGPAAEFIYFQF